MSEAGRDRDTGRHRERWSFKRTGKGAGRDGEQERVSEPEIKIQSGAFGEIPERNKEGAAKTEALRGIERDSRGGGQKTPINRGKDGGQRKSLGAGKTARASEQEGGGR